MKTTKISPQKVRQVAKLARFTLTDNEIHKFQGQLETILEHFETLGKVQVEDVEATYQTTGIKDACRDDKRQHCSLTQKEALQNAPNTQKGYFKVKGILPEN